MISYRKMECSDKAWLRRVVWTGAWILWHLAREPPGDDVAGSQGPWTRVTVTGEE